MNNKRLLLAWLFLLSVNTVINTEETGYILLNETKPEEKESPLRFVGDERESVGFTENGDVGFVRKY